MIGQIQYKQESCMFMIYMLRMDAVYHRSCESSRTAVLWLQYYIDMIDILRKFIRAERTGNWDLHLQALSEMLPVLAASWHNNYTKSVLYYLQQMSLLQVAYPEAYNTGTSKMACM